MRREVWHSKRTTNNAASRKNRPGPRGCAGNGASCRCRTWQGNDHCLRPTPNLAPLLAATRLATKRQETLGCRRFAHGRAGAWRSGTGRTCRAFAGQYDTQHVRSPADDPHPPAGVLDDPPDDGQAQAGALGALAALAALAEALEHRLLQL